MLIVLPGALPEVSVAADLARELPAHAPTLCSWLAAGAARVEPFDAQDRGCSPYEDWLLSQVERQDGPASEPIWLGELVHIALGAAHAALLDPGQMDLHADEARALYDAALPVFASSEFSAAFTSPQRWRLTLPKDIAPQTISPRAAAGLDLSAHWQHDAAARPWRKLLNEIQMVWHEHPANAARAARGAPPVNGLWLYGGHRPWLRIMQTVPNGGAQTGDAQTQVFDALDLPARAGDWGAWLRALAELDAAQLRPLAQASGLLNGTEQGKNQGEKRSAKQGIELLLLGADRSARLSCARRAGLLRWLPTRRHDWSQWWSRPV